MKKLVIPFQNSDDNSFLSNFKNSELLISIKELSRRNFSGAIVKNSFFSILNFDILCCERDWNKTIRVFDQIKNQFDAIRVQDQGVLAFVLETTELPIELVLENGHHNWKAIQAWVDLIGPRLKKIVLSYELPKNRIQEYSKKLEERGIESEVLLIGDILLFYSPRKLLTHQVKSKSEELKLFADSEESPHKGFIVEENIHGTFMIHLKKLFLLERLNEINEMSVSHLRIEHRTAEIEKFMLKQTDENLILAIQSFPFARTRGYFDINKSDILFPKLKNELLENKREEIIGEVISSKKGFYTAVRLHQEIKIAPNKISFITGEGKKFISEIKSFQNIEGEDLKQAHRGSLVIINHIKKATPRTVLMLAH